MQVLDKGYVRLVDHMGSDLSFVNAARVSFEKESSIMSTKDERLIKYLAQHGHTSPFRHATLEFEVRAPLMVARQWFKYRVGSSHLEETGMNYDGATDDAGFDDPLYARNESCFAGNQVIRLWWQGFRTVKALYDKKDGPMPYVRSINADGEIVKNRIKEIWAAGKSNVYRVTSELGFTIDVTSNHRFLTPEGWKELNQLIPGSVVMMNGLPAYRSREWLHQKYVIEGLEQAVIAEEVGCSVHTIRAWVRKHGLQQDQIARMQIYNQINGVFGKGLTNETSNIIRDRSQLMSQSRKGIPCYATGEAHHAFKGDEATQNAGLYRARKLYKKEYCQICSATDKLEIHHLNKNELDNRLENVKVVCPKHHHMYHGDHVLMVAHPVPISSIDFIGEQDTYDIEMSGEQNLVVGQFIVHNSRRYVTEEPEFYADVNWLSAPENRKQGSGEAIDPALADKWTLLLEGYQKLGTELYKDALAAGICPEQARLLLPAYGLFIRWRWTASFLAVTHFLNQRLHHDAQSEIQQYAEAVYELTKTLFPVSISELVPMLEQ